MMICHPEEPMSKIQQSVAARVTLAALVLALLPAPAWSDAPGARLEGLLLDTDGRAATGYRVHLIDSNGQDVAQAGTSPGGLYSFRDLPSGHYSLGIESPEGLMAPVAAPPVHLTRNALARRDVKLVQGTAEQQAAIGQQNYSIGLWLAGLTKLQKAGVAFGALRPHQ